MCLSAVRTVFHESVVRCQPNTMRPDREKAFVDRLIRGLGEKTAETIAASRRRLQLPERSFREAIETSGRIFRIGYDAGIQGRPYPGDTEISVQPAGNIVRGPPNLVFPVNVEASLPHRCTVFYRLPPPIGPEYELVRQDISLVGEGQRTEKVTAHLLPKAGRPVAGAEAIPAKKIKAFCIGGDQQQIESRVIFDCRDGRDKIEIDQEKGL